MCTHTRTHHTIPPRLALNCCTAALFARRSYRLIGFFAALCMAVATQYLLPAFSDELVVSLKPVWYFAECFLFVLTGCVIRPAIDSGLSAPLFGNFLALLLVGSLARMVGDVIACVCWQWTLLKVGPASWSCAQWGDLARRVAFVWMATTPKATLQGTLGPKVAKTFTAASSALGDKSYALPAVFIAPAAAVAILYCATIGTLLTFTAGRVLAVYFQEQHETKVAELNAASTAEAQAAVAAAAAERSEGIKAVINHPHNLGDVALMLRAGAEGTAT